MPLSVFKNVTNVSVGRLAVQIYKFVFHKKCRSLVIVT